MTTPPRTAPRFIVGDAVRLWKLRHAEHGAFGVVKSVEPYDGPDSERRGPWSYFVYWTWRDGEGGFAASLPDCMVIGEDEWQAMATDDA